MKTHKPGTPEHNEAWQAAESVKNQNGGMPPSGHTPGPWTAERATPNTINIDGDGFSIGEVYDGAEDTDSEGSTAEANARLIAAAPELLAALENCIETLDAAKHRANGGCEWIAVIEARAAIQKAKGRHQ